MVVNMVVAWVSMVVAWVSMVVNTVVNMAVNIRITVVILNIFRWFFGRISFDSLILVYGSSQYGNNQYPYNQNSQYGSYGYNQYPYNQYGTGSYGSMGSQYGSYQSKSALDNLANVRDDCCILR